MSAAGELYRYLLGLADETNVAVLKGALMRAAESTLQQDAQALKLQSLIERKDAALIVAATQFDFYEKNHREKVDAIPADTLDVDKSLQRHDTLLKADANRHQATLCRRAAELKD